MGKRDYMGENESKECMHVVTIASSHPPTPNTVRQVVVVDDLAWLLDGNGNDDEEEASKPARRPDKAAHKADTNCFSARLSRR